MDDVCTLIKETAGGYDQYGNPTGETEEREVMCQVYGVTRSEFYSAATVNLHPEYTIVLSDFADYDGEKKLRYNGALYSVIRTYRDRGSMQHSRGGNYVEQAPNAIELVVGRKIGDGNGET